MKRRRLELTLYSASFLCLGFFALQVSGLLAGQVAVGAIVLCCLVGVYAGTRLEKGRR